MHSMAAREVVLASHVLLSVLLSAALAGCEPAGVQPVRSPVADQSSVPPPSPPGSPAPSVTASPSPPATRLDALSGASVAQTGPGAYRYRVEVPRLEGGTARDGALDAVIRGSLSRAADDFVA